MILTITTLLSGAVYADTDQDLLRRLMEQREILPLQEILDRLDRVRKGRILEAELERRGDRYIYEIEVLDSGGRVWEYLIDAVTGEIVDRMEGD